MTALADLALVAVLVLGLVLARRQVRDLPSTELDPADLEAPNGWHWDDDFLIRWPK